MGKLALALTLAGAIGGSTVTDSTAYQAIDENKEQIRSLLISVRNSRQARISPPIQSLPQIVPFNPYQPQPTPIPI